MSAYFHTFMFTFGLEKSVEDELNLNFSLSYSLVHNFAMMCDLIIPLSNYGISNFYFLHL